MLSILSHGKESNIPPPAIFSGWGYYTLTGQVTKEVLSEKVIEVTDGDTLKLESGQKVRLLGINTPEKGKPFYAEAKAYTFQFVNRTLRFESYGYDKYNRLLAHAFDGSLHLNGELISQGLALLYYYEEDRYYTLLDRAEERAREQERGLWKKSPFASCISLRELSYVEKPKRCTNTEVLSLQNSCEQDISALIKDDATHQYEVVLRANAIYSKNFSCIFNDEGDSLYIWDKEGLLLFHRY